MNLVDNKLKDHMGIAPDPTQYPDSWYITQLNRTLEPHSTLYQYIVNHQMQADSIASHLGTASATTTKTAGKLSKRISNKARGEVAVHAQDELVGEAMTAQEGLQLAADVADRVDEQADMAVDVEVDVITTGSHGTSLIPLMMRDITALSVTVSHGGNDKAITLTQIPIKEHKATQ